MADRDLPEGTLLYAKLGAVGILGGLLMTTPLVEMYWQGSVAIGIGIVALGMAIKDAFTRRSQCLDSEGRDEASNADPRTSSEGDAEVR